MKNQFNSKVFVFLLALATALTVSANAQSTPSVTVSVVAGGLNCPRGLAFGRDGSLYITEAGYNGFGTQIPGPAPGVLLDYGQTGSVTRLKNNVQTRIYNGLPNLTVDPNGFQLTPSVNGSIQTFGITDVAFDRSGNPAVLTGYATNPSYRSQLGNNGFYLGQIGRFNLAADGVTLSNPRLADLAQYEAVYNPGNDDIVSDPYSLTIRNGEVFVVDGGANDLLKINADNQISTAAVFPARTVPNSPFPVQAVPTGVALGPDNALYVSEFTGYPFIENFARIWRVVPGQPPQILASGLTQITDLAFDRAGNLFVLEYAVQSLLAGNAQGALIKIKPNGQRQTILTQGLVFPTALAIGSDGAIYISNKGSYAGIGEVLRVRIN